MPNVFPQAGAIAYRVVDGTIQVLLITTSSGRNLTIPKGLIDPGFSPADTVLNEAYEEAGIEGRLRMPSIGSYHFEKWGGRCEVEVFAMRVDRVLDHWPESVSRRRLWVDLEQAARSVKHSGLGDLIGRLPAILERTGPPT